MYVHILYTNVGRYVGRQVGGLAQRFELTPETFSRVLRFARLKSLKAKVLGIGEQPWSLLIPV